VEGERADEPDSGEANASSRHDGKHGTVGADSSEFSLRLGKPRRQIGTARYGPVRRVVWEPGWLLQVVSPGDPIRCGAGQHAGREPNRLRNHTTYRHSSAWNQNSGKSARKKQRVAQNALAREVGVSPRGLSRTGQQLPLPLLAEAPVQATTGVTGRYDPPRNRSANTHTPNETEISCGEPEETIHGAKSVDGRHVERKSPACSPSASSIG